jgi:periplasmic divalent cation tolerance protein
MPRKNEYAIAFVTAPDLKTARTLARAALVPKLAGCVNIIPRIESHYWWEGKLEKGTELLLVLKTTRKKVAALQEAILKAHPYDTAEFIVLGIDSGSKRYLDWIEASVGSSE